MEQQVRWPSLLGGIWCSRFLPGFSIDTWEEPTTRVPLHPTLMVAEGSWVDGWRGPSPFIPTVRVEPAPDFKKDR